jgi:NAD(P)H-flavin reductase
MEEFQDMTAQHTNFLLISTVTAHRSLSWPYEKGHIDREMLRRYLIGLKGPVYYIAGPSGMVTAMIDLLHSSGVSDDDMKTEEFGGYNW